ncbi:hypothetical protein FNV43_RR01622 [Rhamnella rubrinervis]|uniref:Uncharacterized protein n=1 Tax=Rhamnella rubrinervis TaxID=2594499 RepID=A0A8K0MS73_9ROSA|nr:hypothetical protein FNV43_RR01622 [Rhamnella rubrinervis]
MGMGWLRNRKGTSPRHILASPLPPVHTHDGRKPPTLAPMVSHCRRAPVACHDAAGAIACRGQTLGAHGSRGALHGMPPTLRACSPVHAHASLVVGGMHAGGATVAGATHGTPRRGRRGLASWLSWHSSQTPNLLM